MSVLTSILRTADENIDRLSDPHELKLAAEDIAVCADQVGARWLVAASDVAERLLGAILAGEHQTIEVPRDRADLEGTVLIFDVNLASGVTVARAANRIKRFNPDRVVAASLYTLAGSRTPTAQDCQVDELIVLRSEPILDDDQVSSNAITSGI